MKVTLKNFENQYEKMMDLTRKINNFPFGGDAAELYALETEKKFVKDWISTVPEVNVSFMIGSRIYYEQVNKIGKAYLKHGKRMTKSRGYYCIEEISEITDKMNESMISDSYYY